MRRVLGAMCVAAAVAVGGVSGAGAGGLACGAVVTSDVKLTSSLTGCEGHGLVVGADGVTIDLNGFSVAGTGTHPGDEIPRTGVRVADHTGVTVKNGTVSGFAVGVWFAGGTTHSEARSLRIDNVETGIRVSGFFPSPSHVRLVGNTVTGASSGIVVSFSSFVHLERNSLVGLHTGVEARFSPSTSLVRNVASENAWVGIYLEDSGGSGVRYERNVANANGHDGIQGLDNHGDYLQNTTNANRGSGLLLLDSDPSHGPAFVVSRNVANANRNFGIFTNLQGVGGEGNRANANGLAQCVGVSCS